MIMKTEPTLIKTTLDKLKKGDIFQFSNNRFDSSEGRFHSYNIDANNRLAVNFGTYGWDGDLELMRARHYQYQEHNIPSEIPVFIVQKFMISTSEKHKGKTYYISRAGQGDRVYCSYKVNEINYRPSIKQSKQIM